MDKTLKCSECTFETNLNGKLKKHRMQCHSVELFDCRFCTFQFKSEGGLKEHLKSIHENQRNIEKFKRNFCKSETRRKAEMYLFLH